MILSDKSLLSKARRPLTLAGDQQKAAKHFLRTATPKLIELLQQQRNKRIEKVKKKIEIKKELQGRTYERN